MAKSISNTGELREFIVNMMVGVKDGHIDPEKARNITKLAAQVNESFYSEIKVMRVRLDAQQEVHKFGSLPINESTK